MEKKYIYALYTEPTFDNDLVDWFDSLDEALEAGRAAIRDDGVKPEDVAIMKYSAEVFNPDCEWDFYIRMDADGSAWSEDWSAREEMGFIQ